MNQDPWSRKQSLYASTLPKAVSKPRMRWNPFKIVWLAFKRVSTLIGAVVLLGVFFSASLVASMSSETVAELPDEFVIYIELDGEMSDVSDYSAFSDPFDSEHMTVKDFNDAVYAAKDDPRVKGIVANLKQGGYELANIQEMRAALQSFRESEKFAYIYSDSFADAGNLGTYYLASVFDEIWMQPMGLVGIMGVNAEMPFYRNVLDKLGVKPEFMQRKEYKTAYESFTNSSMSAPNREMTEDLIEDITAQISNDIAKDRNITPTEFKALVSKGLLVDHEAKSAKLIDVLAYGDELVKKINKDVTGDPEDDELSYIDIRSYSQTLKPDEEWLSEEVLSDALHKETDHQPDKKTGQEQKSLALIYVSGMILSTDEGGNGGVAAADDISQALYDAAEDDDVGAVVLRVDSPGGSPVASESILRGVEIVQSKGKKVIVSMGGTAASGGYWVACYADRIFVLPTTVTGSIGVLGGKFSAQELWKNIGVNWDRVSWGENSGMWSMNTPFSDSEAARVNMMLDNVYVNFIDRVSKGRKMSKDAVEKIARGHVWSGKRAIDIGIADEFGGLDDALDYAAVAIGEKSRHDVDVVIMPKPLSAFERIIDMLEGQVIAGNFIGSQAQVLDKLSPFVRDAMMGVQSKGALVYQPLDLQ